MTEMTEQLILAIHQYLARTPSKIMLVNFEDLFGQLWQINIPATIAEYPNWRRKLKVSLEMWQEHSTLNSISKMLQTERPKKLVQSKIEAFTEQL
jgi:(1->4)-alpha-D-glucan 1-alpha-D-glucosylmutase